jgi:hypothetical protein
MIPGMPTDPTRPPGRYDIRQIARLIESLRQKEGLSMEAFAHRVGLPRKQDYEKRKNNTGATWEVEEIARVADAFGKHVGWPFVTLSELRALLASVEGED